MSDKTTLQQLPSVHDVLDRIEDLTERYPHRLLAEEVRAAIEAVRGELLSGKTPEMVSVERRVRASLTRLEAKSLRSVINATGVVLHTNLGRAPLGTIEPIEGYSNLEFDLERGRRGRRDVHVRELIERLLGKPGVAVNNNAAAVYLVLSELASGREVIVSRGELIEIGEGFRIPDIMARSGAILREVGTTNKTTIDDYAGAINDNTALLMAVHHSNFRITGFTAKPGLRELASLAHDRDLPLYEDLGSGCIADLRPFGVTEPLVSESLDAGADLVSFSGDKLFGGPQAGLIVGDEDLVGRVRKNPMFRAFRLDKLIYQTLEATLRSLLFERWDEIPALGMIRMPAEEIRRRADALTASLPADCAEIVPGESMIGGGSTPEQPIPTWLIAFRCERPNKAARELRSGDPPVVARIEDERLLLDLRTVLPGQDEALSARLRQMQADH